MVVKIIRPEYYQQTYNLATVNSHFTPKEAAKAEFSGTFTLTVILEPEASGLGEPGTSTNAR
jgi:hypothetical protein